MAAATATAGTVPTPGTSPAEWARLWDGDRSGLLELVLEANGISKKDFLEGTTLTLKSLDLFLLRIPQGIPVLSLFPNLTTLRLMNIGLRGINYLAPLRNSLQVLWLSENDITGELKPGQLDCLVNLRELFLHFNTIEQVAPNALLGLDKLETLWLNENRLSGELVGVSHLKNLRVLNLGNNKLSLLASAASSLSALPPSLVEVNLAGNSLERFQHLQPLLRLPRLARLTLNDATYGVPNPVCRLSNLQTFLIFHMGRSLAVLDGVAITQQQRSAAKSTYMQKYAFYSMRARALRNNMRLVQTEVISVARQRVAQILSGTTALQRLLYRLREADCCAAALNGSSNNNNNNSNNNSGGEVSRTGGVGGGRTPSFCGSIITAPNSVCFSSILSPLIEQLGARLRDTLQVCADINALADAANEGALRAIVDEVVRRSLAELHSGGNVRYEEQCAVPSTSGVCSALQPEVAIPEGEAFVWFRSCVDLFRSRMFLPEFSAKGVLDMVVTRVTKVHNKALRSRFDAALEELVDVSDPSFKRGIEYLFLILPPSNDDSSNISADSNDGGINYAEGESASSSSKYGLDTGVGPAAAINHNNNNNNNSACLSRILEEGLASADEPIVLTNSIYLHEAKKLSLQQQQQQQQQQQRSALAPHRLKGRVVLCKVFLGRSFPEAAELSSGMSDADLSSKLPKIDGRKMLPPDTHAVMRFKKSAADLAVSSSSSASAAAASSSAASTTRQRIWFVYRNELVLPEYVVYFDYKMAASANNNSSSPVGDISHFPWLNSNDKSEKLRELYLSALRGHNLVDPTRRGDLDAILNRASAATFASSHLNNNNNNSSNCGAVAQNTNELLLMTPSLIQFATKTAEMAAAALKGCSSVCATVTERVDGLRKTNPAILSTIAANLKDGKAQEEEGGHASGSSSSSSSSSVHIEALVAAHRNSMKDSVGFSSFIHLFANDFSRVANSSSGSGSGGGSNISSPTRSQSPAMQLLRSIAVPQWSASLHVLVLPFAALGPQLPAAEMATFELPSLTELDLSFNSLKEFCVEKSTMAASSSAKVSEEEQQSPLSPQQQQKLKTPFNAPQLLRLNLAENELFQARDLAAIASSHPKLQHALFFGNEFSALAIDDYIVATQLVLDTLDGVSVHERLTGLRALPSSLTAASAFFARHPTWFDLSFVGATDGEQQLNNSNNNNNNNDSESDCFTFELLPTKFTRQNRMTAFVDERIAGALKRAATMTTTTNNKSIPNNGVKQQIATLNLSALRIERGAIPEFVSSLYPPPSAGAATTTTLNAYSFSRLRRLDLSRNNLKNAVFKSFVSSSNSSSGQGASSAGVCPLLEFMSLASNRISSLRCLDAFAPNLRSLDVQGNEILSLIGIPVSLQVLYAEDNRLSTLADVMRCGPDSSNKGNSSSNNNNSNSNALSPPLSRATELYLAGNHFYACRDIALPLKERNNGDLFILDLARNPFRDGDLDAMHFALCHLPKVKVYNGAPVDAAQLQTAREVYAGKLSEELLLGKVGPPSTWRLATDLNFANMALREIDLLSLFTGLQHVVLESNLVTDVSPLGKCMQLQSLDVSFNRGLGGGIAALSNNNPNNSSSIGQSLAGARNSLSSLALEGCNIHSVAALQLALLPNLRFLNLKNNEIQDMATGFEGLTRLKELLLDQNKIKTVDGLGRCAQLTRLSLDENLIKSLEGVRYLRELQFLSVAMNRIADLNELEHVAQAGSILPGGATNAENAHIARALCADAMSHSQQQQQQQQQQFCKIDDLSVQSNPCIRKLGSPTYRILCLRMIPSLRTIDGQYLSQDEFDRAFPATMDTNASTMMLPQTSLFMPQQQQQQQPSLLPAVSRSSGVGGVGGGILQPLMVQPLTTFKMVETNNNGANQQQQQQQQRAIGGAVNRSSAGGVAPRQPQPAPVSMSSALNMYGYGPSTSSTAAVGCSSSSAVNSSRAQPTTASAAAVSGIRRPAESSRASASKSITKR